METEGNGGNNLEFKCKKYENIYTKEITYINTKHVGQYQEKDTTEISVLDSECSLCDDKFDTTQECVIPIK